MNIQNDYLCREIQDGRHLTYEIARIVDKITLLLEMKQ